MWVVGLTGGVGSGKSAAARFFSELNITVIDADHIAKELLNIPEISKTVIDHFGPSICDRAGALNRYSLRQAIFTDEQKRHWLEAFLHPKIRERIKDLISGSTSAYTVVVIPLLIETQKEDYVDRILVIDVPESMQISRLTHRDGITEAEAKQMIAAQAARKTRLALADDVIENTDTLATLKNKILGLHDTYLQIARKNKKI
ncbi:MAG: dephospho-CoA kinase [Gammaproteobacteria bacterium]|jgi:dephospho-CoA kinase